MELSGVNSSISYGQSKKVLPQAASEPAGDELDAGAEDGGGGKANGVISKLNEGGHFKAVADIRLRISHFDNPALEKIDPELLPAVEDIPGSAYEKFLEKYRALYTAAQPQTEPEEPLAPQEPVNETQEADPVPLVIEEPVLEIPVVPQDPLAEEPLNEPTETDTTIVTALEELMESQSLEEEPETLDIAV